MNIEFTDHLDTLKNIIIDFKNKKICIEDILSHAHRYTNQFYITQNSSFKKMSMKLNRLKLQEVQEKITKYNEREIRSMRQKEIDDQIFKITSPKNTGPSVKYFCSLDLIKEKTSKDTANSLNHSISSLQSMSKNQTLEKIALLSSSDIQSIMLSLKKLI